MERVIIFGAGKAGQLAYEATGSKHLVIAFADNDSRKAGTMFLGRKVVAPAVLRTIAFDRVIIASIHCEPIKAQLKKMDLAEEKIIVFKADVPIPASLLVAPHLDQIRNNLDQLGFLSGKPRSREERVILFGAGSAGRGALDTIRRFAEIVCIADNDPAKQGKKLEGVEIVSPRSIPGTEHDYIIIASMHAGEIRAQLLSMGISPLKIKGTSDLPQRERDHQKQ